MNTEKQLQRVTENQSERLKNLGFDWETSHYYKVDKNAESFYTDSNNEQAINAISAPTVALALKWCRDVKGIMNIVTFNFFCEKYMWNYVFMGDIIDSENKSIKIFDTYELAESALLDEMLTILEQERDEQQ